MAAETDYGLHFTPAECSIWRQRWAGTYSSNYKKKGDVQTNSPGEVDRIKTAAASFRSNPAQERWRPTYTASVGSSTDLSTPQGFGDKTRDAGFYYLMTGDLSYAKAVRDEIMAQVAEPSTNPSNTAIWKPGGSGDTGPAFSIASWLKRGFLYPFDYTKAAKNGSTPIWSDADKAGLRAWLLKWGSYIVSNYDPSLDKLFTNRDAGVFTSTTGTAELMYYGGTWVNTRNKSYNNRKCVMADAVGEIGLYYGDAALTFSGGRYYKEWIKYGMYSGGLIADIHRGLDYATLPAEKGFAYAMTCLGAMGSLADAFARAGDPSLYEFATMEGTPQSGSNPVSTAVPSGGQPKTLLMTIKRHCDLINLQGTKIYTTAQASRNGSVEWRADGVSVSKSWYSPFDGWFSVFNLYYQDAYVKNTYLRLAGAGPYATNVASTGPENGWTLSGRAGSLFYAGKLEGVVNPFTPPDPDKQPQTITVQPIADKVYAPGLTFNVVASASSGLTPITTITSGPGTISGNVVTVTGAGEIVLKTVQAGNGDYLPAPEVLTKVKVAKASQTISFGTLEQKRVDDPAFSVSATASSGLPVAFASDNALLLQLDTDTFQIQGEGTGSITATQAGNANYNAATPVTRTFPIVEVDEAPVFDILYGKSYVDTPPEQIGSGAGEYSLYQRVWNSLGGTFAISRFVFTSGDGIAANVVTNFRVEVWDGDSWELLFPMVTNNTQLTFDITLPEPVTTYGKLRITSKGKSTTKYGQAQAYGNEV